MKSIFEYLPKKTFSILIFLIVFIYFSSWGLNYLTNFNNKKIEEINKQIENLPQEYQKEALGQDVYKSIIHFIALNSLLEEKNNISNILSKINLYLPKNLKINSISIDMDKKEIILESSAPDWIEYAKFVKYFQSSTEFPGTVVSNVSFDKEKYIVNFTVKFTINPTLLQ